MKPANDERLTGELLRLVGENDLIALAEAFGGTRLFFPKGEGRGQLRAAVSAEAFDALTMHYGGSYIRVPLAKEIRARQYRAAGHSNAQIARRLGMTETAIDKLFSRMVDKPVKGSADPRQSDLFAS